MFGFRPDRGRTAAIDLAIRRSLADSVGQILDRAREIGIGWQGDIGPWRERLLAQSKAPPQLWACYHSLVQAVLRGDAEAVAARASELLARSPDQDGRPGTVLTISEADLGAVDAARYRTVIDSDPVQPLDLVPVPPQETLRMRGLAEEGRGLLARADPVLLDEIDTLGHQIVLAASGGSGKFGGAATVFLWGAVIFNPAMVPDRIILVESLAHETAHALLFGMLLGADLTTNDPAERYPSPLRRDPRPMEGIVHATYVLARMNLALARLREAPGLRDSERALIDSRTAHNATAYEAGLRTVLAHARFTPCGEVIFAACRAEMAAAA